MSECAMRSACTRRAPKATNISPTTDLPAAMPPVRPTFSNWPPHQEPLPQRHGATEKALLFLLSFLSVSLCLCGGLTLNDQARDSPGPRLPRPIFAAFTVLKIS